MKWTYRCPKCNAHLNPAEDHIVLLGECEQGKGLMVFASRPGDYGLHHAAELEVVEGAEWRFSCPVCRADLATEATEVEGAEERKLAVVTMTDARGGEHRVLFSRIAGEKATFVVSAEGVVLERFGEHQMRYQGMVWMKYF